MAALSYLAKLKRGLGQAFGAHFLQVFFRKSVPYLILCQCMDKVSMLQLISFSR